jgi:hypothetical protein
MPSKQDIRDAFARAGVEIPGLVEVLPRPDGPLLGFPVRAADAIDRWRTLRAVTERSGYYPVVVADYDLLSELSDESPTTRESLAAAAELDAAQCLEERVSENEELLQQGATPGVEPLNRFIVPFEITSGEPRDDVHVVLLPTTVPWHAAAHLGFCAVNYDLNPEHHAAVHRRWYEQYGAELVTASGDVLEFAVARPPAKSNALALAREQYGYCPDIVEQGLGTLENLASSLAESSVWFFWRD